MARSRGYRLIQTDAGLIADADAHVEGVRQGSFLASTSAGGLATTGLGPPATLADGSTYFELDAFGQVVAEWVGASGSPLLVANFSASPLLVDHSTLTVGTAVKAGTPVIFNGFLYRRIADGTIGATFNPANWNLVFAGSTTIGVGTPPSTLELGSLYFQENGAGAVIAVWLGTTTTPVEVLDATNPILYGTQAARLATTIGTLIDGTLWVQTDSGGGIFQAQGGAWAATTIGTGSTLPAPDRRDYVIGFDSVAVAPAKRSVGFWAPRSMDVERRRRKASKVLATDSTSLVNAARSSAGFYAVDNTFNAGLGQFGGMKLDAPATAGGTKDVTFTLPSTWNFGDGDTAPLGYLRLWVAIDDNRDPAVSSVNFLRVYLGNGTDNFVNTGYQDIGSCQTTEYQTRIKSRMQLKCIWLNMLGIGSTYMPASGAASHNTWITAGTGPAFSGVNELKFSLSGKAPLDGSAYVQPHAYILGAELVPLPPVSVAGGGGARCVINVDWAFRSQMPSLLAASAQFGIQPFMPIYGAQIMGTQTAAEMNLAELHQMHESVGAEFGAYSFIDTPSGAAGDGLNNFGGPFPIVSTTAGVPYSARSKASIEDNFCRMNEAMIGEGWKGYDLQCGQERKLRDDGEDLLKRYASYSRNFSAAEAWPQWWPLDNPYRGISTGCVSGTEVISGVVQPTFTRRVQRAILQRELLILHFHEIRPDTGGTSTGMPHTDFMALMTYLTQAGNFDGVNGKIIGMYEALELAA